MSRRRFATDEATTVRPPGGGDGGLPTGLLAPLDDHPGPARRLPHSKAAAMVASIVDTAAREAAAEASASPDRAADADGSRAAASSGSPDGRRGAGVSGSPDGRRGAGVSGSPDRARRGGPAPRRLVPLLASALIVAAVVGAAAAVVTTRYLTPARAPQVSPPGPAAPPAPPPAPPAPPAADERAEPAPIEPAAAPEASAGPAAPRPTKPAPRDKDPAAARGRALPDDAPVEDVLALANQRRKERAWREADELYRRVIRSHPRSDAAVVAEVASATLHLEHLGDPAGALAGYRRALRARPSGALGEEARWGITEAHRARGDRADEAAALRAFLDAHPGSAMAPAAAKRLAELAR